MKSKLCFGEIFGLSSSGEIVRFTHGEIKSVHFPNKVKISPRSDFTAKGDLSRP